MELFRRLAHPNLIILAVAVVVASGLTLFQPGLIAAQQCNWENWNCTPTPENTPLTPIPTSTINPIEFQPPQYDVPTSIPPLDFPAVPPPLEFTPIPAPANISIEITPIATPDYSSSLITPSNIISLSTINTSLNLSVTTPLTLDFSLTSTSTGGISGTGVISGQYSGFVGDVVSYTGWLSGQVEAIQGTGFITVTTAPTWYAPALPRPVASVGWTFEILTDPTADIPGFTLSSWAGFFGYISSLPFQMVKLLWQFVAYLGPLGLFLGWLMIMFVIVVAIQFQVFIVKFFIVAIRLVARLLELLGEWVPTGG